MVLLHMLSLKIEDKTYCSLVIFPVCFNMNSMPFISIAVSMVLDNFITVEPLNSFSATFSASVWFCVSYVTWITWSKSCGSSPSG